MEIYKKELIEDIGGLKHCYMRKVKRFSNYTIVSGIVGLLGVVVGIGSFFTYCSDGQFKNLEFLMRLLPFLGSAASLISRIFINGTHIKWVEAVKSCDSILNEFQVVMSYPSLSDSDKYTCLQIADRRFRDLKK